MYRATGTWAGCQLYVHADLPDMTAVEQAITVMKQRFDQGSYRLPSCLNGTTIKPQVLCITAIKHSSSGESVIVQMINLKK